MKRYILLLLFFSGVILANGFSYILGVVITGTVFPYFEVKYNLEKTSIGCSVGMSFVEDEKNEFYDFLLSPKVSISCFPFKQFFIQANFRTIVVFPYQQKQLYLFGAGIGYGIPFNNGKINFLLSENISLPISAASEVSWPIPILECEYEF
ncbi:MULTISPECIES: hypothetical protein [unclassified Thermosipho (in: thermotogales)]|uniref:hypothetical protein n=1 Tax=unclassified Thermosipho (in: thermotogales) TaxID=2676525 RepID=UPI0009852232|nr:MULTISPECIES: hypothetical protein [unclassified Thermosipho (in: thermotogales)]MBT1247711.1 hypothetical protein [Thermosipho sp. 1244]OOC46810.1 hypothetical protein XO09_04850 [Thermosipho sp. 1223]